MSLAAGVLSAALALPQAGLVVAYDFARANLLNWSEDLSQGSWVKTSAVATLSTIRHPEGVPLWNLTENTANADHRADQSIPVVPDGLFIAEFDMARLNRDTVSFGFGTGGCWANGLPAFSMNLATGQGTNLFPAAPGSSITARALGGGVYRVRITARMASAPVGTPTLRFWTGVASTSQGDGVGGVAVTRAKLTVNQEYEYERTTDGQTLMDRSVRLWPAPPRRTNLLTWTEEPNMPAWTNGSSTPTVTLNTGTTPRGFPAWTISGGYKAISVFNRAGATLTSSCVMKGGAGSATTFFVFPKGAGQSITVDANGTVTANSLVDGTYTVTPLEGGWFEVALTYTPDADRTISTLYVHSASGSVQIGEARVNLSPVALPYERQTDGVAYDLSLRGKNLLPASETFGFLTDTYFTGARANGNSTISANNTGAAVVATTRQWFGAATGNVQVSLPVQPGRTYTLSALIETAGSAGVTYHFGMHVFRGGAYIAEPGVNLAPNTSRTRVSMTYTVPVDGGAYTVAPRLAVYNLAAGATASTTLSQVQLEEGPAATYYERSASHSVLGTTAGPDSSDPIWGPAGLTFDGVDDGTMVGAFAMPDGDFTALIAFTPLVDSGTTDGKAITRGGTGTAWRNNLYLGPVSGLGMNFKAGIYHVAGGHSNSGFSYLNFPGVLTVGQARVAVVRVSGLTVRGMYLLPGGVPNAQVSQPLPQPPPGGVFQGFGSTANVTLHAFTIWSRALTDAEIHQAYRFIRNQLSIKRGITI